MLFKNKNGMIIQKATKIKRNVFYNIHSNEDGGAICSTFDARLHVYECFFSNCDSSTNGGAIFKQNSALYVSKCIFFRVVVTRKVNNCGGNVIESRNCVFAINKTSALNCGDSSNTGDSPFFSNNCNCEIKTINCSDYIEYMVGSTIAECYLCDVCSISYSMSSNCTNYRLSWCKMKSGEIGYISFCNFVLNTVYAYFDTVNYQRISNCYLFGNKETVKTTNAYISDCFGDCTLSGVTTTAKTLLNLNLFNQISFNANICSCNLRQRNMLFMNTFLVVGTMLFLVCSR